jgi:gamma-glutamyltranspeptidase/glutathione hydrolase
MSPTIVFNKEGKVLIVTGSAGGPRIIGDVAQSIQSMVAFDLDAQEAANIPHYQNMNGITEIESPESSLFGVGLVDYDVEEVADELKKMGHSDPSLPLENRTVNINSDWSSKLSSIQVVRNGSDELVLVGGVDPRSGGSIGGNNHNRSVDISAANPPDDDTDELMSAAPYSQVTAALCRLIVGWVVIWQLNKNVDL